MSFPEKSQLLPVIMFNQSQPKSGKDTSRIPIPHGRRELLKTPTNSSESISLKKQTLTTSLIQKSWIYRRNFIVDQEKNLTLMLPKTDSSRTFLNFALVVGLYTLNLIIQTKERTHFKNAHSTIISLI